MLIVARARRRGTTLLELVLVLAVAAILACIALPRASALVDSLRVRGAASDVAALLAAARHAAIMRGAPTALVLDSARGLAIVRRADDTLRVRPVRDAFGVTFSASRDSVAYAPNGLGLGAANTQIILRRGRAAETVWVARAGRVRGQR